MSGGGGAGMQGGHVRALWRFVVLLELVKLADLVQLSCLRWHTRRAGFRNSAAIASQTTLEQRSGNCPCAAVEMIRLWGILVTCQHPLVANLYRCHRRRRRRRRRRQGGRPSRRRHRNHRRQTAPGTGSPSSPLDCRSGRPPAQCAIGLGSMKYLGYLILF